MSRIKKTRMRVETAVLKTYFPKSKWIPEDDPENLEVEIKTNSGSLYKLTLYLSLDYPNSQPEMIVSKPYPLRGYGETGTSKLLAASGKMHTLGAKNGRVQICHFNPSNWSPNITLYKVILKGRIWLEAYEIYLRTGKDIDTYLPHQ